MPATEPTVVEVFASLIGHPWRHLVLRWNWKSGVTSAIIRGSIFFTANLAAGLGAATGAMLTEFAYRTFLSGAYGAVTQALRKARPPWAAALSAAVVLPVCSHSVEFTVHWLRGTPKLAVSVIASVSFSVLSTLFNSYVMRRGVLVVGDGDRKTLLDDFAMMPRMIGGFVALVPVAVWRLARRDKSACPQM
jgi:hypothetical protein